MSDYLNNQEENDFIDNTSEEYQPAEQGEVRKNRLPVIIAAVIAAVAVIALALFLILGGDKSGTGDKDNSSKGDGNAEEDIEIVYDYTVNPDGKTCTIVGIKSAPEKLKKIKFPSEIDGYAVTKIGSGEVVTYEFGDSIGAIFGYQYLGVSGLEEIETIEVSKGVVEIADGAFSHCYALKKLVLPDGLTTIGNDIFSCYSVANLTDINIPSSVTSFGAQVIFGLFDGNINFNKYGNSMYLGDKNNPYYLLVKIDKEAECNTVHKDTGIVYADLLPSKRIIVEEGNKKYKSIDGNLYSKDGATLLCYATGNTKTSVILPQGVTAISHSAFSGSEYLKEIIIPDGVTSIGDNAFSYCKALVSVEIPDSVTVLGKDVFLSCVALEEIELPEGLTSISENLLRGCVALKKIELPEGVTVIDKNAFNSCRALEKINIPDSVTAIGAGAFSACDSLSNITLPEGIQSIGEGAFTGCGFTEVYLPGSLTNLHPTAFQRSENLEKIQVSSNNPNFIAYRGNLYSKDGKTLLIYAPGKSEASFTIPSNVTVIGESAFIWHSFIKEIEIPYGVVSIENNAFARVRNLAKVSLPESLVSIGESAFSSCELKSIDLPSSLVSIGDGAFSGCETLISAVIPSGVSEISDSLFSGCTKLESITLHNGITRIGANAFYNCRALTSITIPESVTFIGGGAISNCVSLTSIYISAGVATIEYGTYRVTDGNNGISSNSTSAMFCNCTSLENIEVDPANPNYKSIDGNLYTKDGKTLIQYAIGKKNTSFTLPSGVTTIGANAFSLSPSLVSVELSDGVTAIETHAFEKCDKLESIVIPSSLCKIDDPGYTDMLTDVYYKGSRSAWLKIEGIDYIDMNMDIKVHYNHK